VCDTPGERLFSPLGECGRRRDDRILRRLPRSTGRSPKAPRALLYSNRAAVEWRKWHAYLYEFEDVIMEIEDVDLVAPPLGRTPRGVELARRLSGRRLAFADPKVRPTPIRRDYDVFFAFLAFAGEADQLTRLQGLRERCGTAIAFLEELYTPHVDVNRKSLELLGEMGFDRVFMFNPGPAQQVEEIAGCPTEFLSIGVDALKFCPFPDPPERCVDLYQFGRRSPVTHDAALAMAEQDGRFYLYDTVFNVPIPDYRAHRKLIAETMKRAKFFFAYRAGQDLPDAMADDPMSSRYFEGTAGGAVLLGNHPRTPEYDALFPWPDATIEIPYDAVDLRGIVADLEAQPERLATARHNNVTGALRRHDWTYPWLRVLETAGLEPTAAARARLERMAELATLADAEGVPA
jgi:hypothetical protein